VDGQIRPADVCVIELGGTVGTILWYFVIAHFNNY
jgi:CTP synthase (UTP-ammonia lyase)